ncbi:MAG: DUF5678 domain-containing protein [candidate division KSB1 bacterium]|nr:DUF5678 domain-containing protein [candidate division KSB1 bacterium]MDZ7367167.1 DUF5678 domain-containing protein [candidate division KSB1 bacterium]MDZ7405350.1 DUF5678 domain-containing protein [candidate division KSB1 bacterium]
MAAEEKMQAFRLNQANFEKHLDELLAKHLNQYVAIWQEKVVDHDDDKIKLARRVCSTIGYLPIYIQKVTKEPIAFCVPVAKLENENEPREW